jgi:hypothetical protein
MGLEYSSRSSPLLDHQRKDSQPTEPAYPSPRLQIIPPNWSDCANDGKLHFCSTAHPSTLLVESACFLSKSSLFDDFFEKTSKNTDNL